MSKIYDIQLEMLNLIENVKDIFIDCKATNLENPLNLE